MCATLSFLAAFACGGPIDEVEETQAAVEIVDTGEGPTDCDNVSCINLLICTPIKATCCGCSDGLGDAETPPHNVPPGGGGGGGTTEPLPPPNTGAEDCSAPGDEDGDGKINCEDEDCHRNLGEVTVHVANDTRHISELFRFTSEVTNAPSVCQGANALIYTVHWSFGGGASDVIGPTALHAFAAPGDYDVLATVECAGCSSTVSTQVLRVHAWDAVISAPTGDPRPGGSASRQNEIVVGTTAETVVQVEATVTPPSGLADARTRLRWALGRGSAALPTVTHTFSPNTGRGTIQATLTFSKALPAAGEAFGLYELIVAVGRHLEKQKIEIFYNPTDKSDFDGVLVPNWFHYYTQAYLTHFTPAQQSQVKFRYEPSAGNPILGTQPGKFGQAIGMTRFGYSPAVVEKDVLILFDEAYSRVPVDITGYCGQFGFPAERVDFVWKVMDHERRHLHQIRTCDQQLLSGIPAAWRGHRVFANGWSWNANLTNYFSLGADGAPGVAGFDDNRNRRIDGGGPSDNSADSVLDVLGSGSGDGELGQGDDVALSGRGTSWCSALGAIPPLFTTAATNVDVERDACSFMVNQATPIAFDDDWAEFGLNWDSP